MKIITTSRNLRGVLAAVAVGAFACSLASASSAADTENPPRITVKYADLKVSNRDGAAALLARIHVAAREVCHSFEGRDLNSKMLMNACVHKAIEDAVAKVDQPELFEAYNQHNGRPTQIVLAASR